MILVMPEAHAAALLTRIPITVIKPLTVGSPPADGASGNGDAEPQNDFIARLGWQTLVPGAQGSVSPCTARQQLCKAFSSHQLASPLEPSVSMTSSSAVRPGAEVRKFVAVPDGSTWAELRLRAGSYDANRVRDSVPAVVALWLH